MSLQKWLLIIYLWAREYPVTDAAQEVEITKTSAIDVFQWLREVCTTKLLQNQIVLGGPGSKLMSPFFITNQRYVICKCKHINKMFDCKLCLQNHRGRATSQEVWVFGMVDTSHHPALGYMEIVQNRNAAALLPIIQAHTAPGTIVHSDEWAAYNSVQGLPKVEDEGMPCSPATVLFR